MKKKLIVGALLLIMVTGLFGCGKKEGTGQKIAAASRDYVYQMKQMDLNTEDLVVNNLLRSKAGIYAYSYRWTEEGDNILSIFELHEDGSQGASYDIPFERDASINRVFMNDDGTLFCLKNVYYTPESGSEERIYPLSSVALAEDVDAAVDAGEDTDVEGETSSDETEEGDNALEEEGEDSSGDTADEAVAEEAIEEGEYIDDYYLIKMTLEGEELFSIKLNDLPEMKTLKEENDFFYVGDMFLDKGNAVYITALGKFMKFDLDGNLEKTIPEGGEMNPLDGCALIQLEDGRIIAIIYEEEGMSLATVDLDAASIKETYEIPGRSYDFSFYPGNGYDLYMTNSYGMYGYNLGDEDKTQLLSYIDSDFSFYDIYQVTAINEKEFFAVCNDWESSDYVAKFTKVPPEEVKEKKEITLAMVYNDWGIRQQAIKFNKASENYRINIKDYSSLYDTEEDWGAGQSRLNTDIASGNVPDIILLNTSMPVDSYINKGLFEDLKPYFEKDEELALDNYMPNVIEAFSVDGKLYSLVPCYYINTLVAKASDVGDERGWTVEEARKILESKPEGTQFLMNTARGDMLRYCLSMAGNQFINWETGACDFNSEAFIQMLEFIGLFPEEIDWDAMSDDFWNNYDSMWREGKVLTQMMNLGDFRGFNSTEKGTFGEKITMIGFPSSEGEGTVISPSLQFAMSSKSNIKEGAWEFLRIFLMDEYQEKEVTYSFPLSIKRMEQMAADAMSKPYYMDENNNKVEYDDVYYINGVDVIIPPMTKEETEELKTQLYSFTQVYKLDDTLTNIIEEEAAPFYSGQKSAKEVAAIIQSRVQIYVNENR